MIKKILYGILSILIILFLIDYYTFVKLNNTVTTIELNSKNKTEISKDSIDKNFETSWNNYGK